MQKIAVVCFANYCRSPVVEYLLKEYLGDKFLISSYGIAPIAKTDMDRRSRKFLKSINIHPKIHNPKKISKELIAKNDLVLAMDINILMQLNKISSEKGKIKLFNFVDPKRNIPDPYNMKIDSYNGNMEDIKTVCLKLSNHLD